MKATDNLGRLMENARDKVARWQQEAQEKSASSRVTSCYTYDIEKDLASFYERWKDDESRPVSDYEFQLDMLRMRILLSIAKDD